MSLLLRDPVVIGLLPGVAWLRKGRYSVQVDVPLDGGAADLIDGLQRLLEQARAQLRGAGRCELFVSDSVAQSVVLPWQHGLVGEEQMRRYAQVCFEMQGIRLDGDWVIGAALQRYESLGMAVAIPAPWLRHVADIVRSNGLRLASVLPLSFACYCFDQSGKGKKSLVFLEESRRITALVFDGRKFLGMDAEPASEDLGACRRLAQRCALAFGEVHAVRGWNWSGLGTDNFKALFSNDVEIANASVRWGMP